MQVEKSELTLPLAAERLIPHRLPMRLVDFLTEATPGSATVETTVVTGPFTDEAGILDAVGLVEMMAQAYAALRGYEDRRRGQPVKRGFLVGVRGLHLTGEARTGDRLQVKVRTLTEMDAFALAEAEVRRDGEPLAAGNFKLWISPDPAEAA